MDFGVRRVLTPLLKPLFESFRSVLSRLLSLSFGRSCFATPKPTMKATKLLRFTGAVKRDSAIEAWMKACDRELGPIARRWFEVMRNCGNDVREVLHDGHPTACVDDAGFGYVNAFKDHVNVGFFRGAEIPDPAGLLEGTGKFMRHVKLAPGRDFNAAVLARLIETAYVDMKARVEDELRR